MSEAERTRRRDHFTQLIQDGVPGLARGDWPMHMVAGAKERVDPWDWTIISVDPPRKAVAGDLGLPDPLDARHLAFLAALRGLADAVELQQVRVSHYIVNHDVAVGAHIQIWLDKAP